MASTSAEQANQELSELSELEDIPRCNLLEVFNAANSKGKLRKQLRIEVLKGRRNALLEYLYVLGYRIDPIDARGNPVKKALIRQQCEETNTELKNIDAEIEELERQIRELDRPIEQKPMTPAAAEHVAMKPTKAAKPAKVAKPTKRKAPMELPKGRIEANAAAWNSKQVQQIRKLASRGKRPVKKETR
jgi:hypothetical protein